MDDRRFNFTVKKLEAIPAAPMGERVEYFDSSKDGYGLGLRVTGNGVKTFFVRRRVQGKPVRTTLGKFPGLQLDDARKLAAATMGAIAKGEDPNQAKRDARESGTFGELFTWYVATHARSKKDGGAKDESQFKKNELAVARRDLSEGIGHAGVQGGCTSCQDPAPGHRAPTPLKRRAGSSPRSTAGSVPAMGR